MAHEAIGNFSGTIILFGTIGSLGTIIRSRTVGTFIRTIILQMTIRNNNYTYFEQ